MYSKEEEEVISELEIIDQPLQALCARYADIITETTGLPPQRSHDHIIPLMPGAEPVSLRPYRHPWEQKNTI